MDEAFLPLCDLLVGLLPDGLDLTDEDAGVHSYITHYEVDSPVELDVVVTAEGTVRIGSTPPLYYVDTSYRPSFHRLSVTADRDVLEGGAGHDG